jgi:hypothetical protein
LCLGCTSYVPHVSFLQTTHHLGCFAQASHCNSGTCTSSPSTFPLVLSTQSLHVLFSFLNPVNLVDLIIAPPSHVRWIWPHHLSTVMLTSPCKPDWCAITANASTLNSLNTRCLHNSLLACSRHLPCESSCAITALCPLTPCLPQLLIHSCLTPPPFPLLLNIPLLL